MVKDTNQGGLMDDLHAYLIVLPDSKTGYITLPTGERSPELGSKLAAYEFILSSYFQKKISGVNEIDSILKQVNRSSLNPNDDETSDPIF